MENKHQTHSIIITICSTKGGVGKTTLAANLSGLLSDLGFRVLMVDGDIQPGLTSYYPLTHLADHGLYSLIKAEIDPAQCISKTSVADIVISDDPSGSLQQWINSTPDGRIRLRGTLQKLRSDYDFIIIDSQGANTPLQHTTVLAADILLSPIPPDIMSSREFSRGTLAMLESLDPLRALGAPLGQLYGLIYRKDRTKDARIFVDQLTNETFQKSNSRIRILQTFIPQLVAYKNAASQKVPVHSIDQRAKRTLCELLSELLPNLQTHCHEFMGENEDE